MMLRLRIGRAVLIVILACSAMCLLPQTTYGQSQDRTISASETGNDTDLEVQLQILVAYYMSRSG